VKEKKKLGEMLIDGGLLTEEQLKQAVVEHKRNAIKLGEYLVREGIVSSSEIVSLVSQQLVIEKYRPEAYPIDISLSAVIPLEMCQKYQLVPIERTSHLLKIAMTDPMDINALDAIEVHTNIEVEAAICTYQELNQLISSLYGTYSAIGGVLDGMSEMQIESAQDTEAAAMTEDVEVNSLHDMAEEAPVIRLVNSILSQAVREGASDVHISRKRISSRSVSG
jgi:type IV pilus assembly protein PilB